MHFALQSGVAMAKVHHLIPYAQRLLQPRLRAQHKKCGINISTNAMRGNTHLLVF